MFNIIIPGYFLKTNSEVKIKAKIAILNTALNAISDNFSTKDSKVKSAIRLCQKIDKNEIHIKDLVRYLIIKQGKENTDD